MQRRGHNPGFDLVSVELLTYNFAEFPFSFLPHRCEAKQKCVCTAAVCGVYCVLCVWDWTILKYIVCGVFEMVAENSPSWTFRCLEKASKRDGGVTAHVWSCTVVSEPPHIKPYVKWVPPGLTGRWSRLWSFCVVVTAALYEQLFKCVAQTRGNLITRLRHV